MKRILRVLLAIFLISVLICSVVSVGIAKSIGDGTWSVYDNSTTVLGTGGKATYTSGAAVTLVTDKLYSGTGADNDSKAFKIENCYAQWPTLKLTLNKNTMYELSCYYYCDSLDAVQGAFSNAVVLKDGGGKDTKADHLSSLDRNSGYYLDKSGAYTSISNKINANVQAQKWNKLTLSFYSADCTNAVFALRPTVSGKPVYLDALKLEVAAEPEVATGWTMYDNSTAKIGEGGTLRPANQFTIANNDEVLYSGENADDDGISVEVTGGYAQYVTAKIAVEKNKNYEFTAHCYTNSLNASGGIFSHILAIPNGGKKFEGSIFYLDANGGYTYNAEDEKLTISNISTNSGFAANKWNETTISFYSGDLTEVLVVFRPTNQAVVYFDGFSLKEVSKLPGVNTSTADWSIYDNTTKKIGEGGTPTYSNNASVTVVTDNIYQGEGADDDGKAYLLSGDCYAQYVAKKMEFDANSCYKVTAYYKASAIDSFGGMFSDIRMIKNGGAKGEMSTDNLGLISRNQSCYTNKNKCVVALEGQVTSNVKVGEWNKAEFYFYSDTQTSGLLTFRPTIDTNTPVYIDAISLTKVDALPDFDKIPSGWTTYTMETLKIGDGGNIAYGADVSLVDDFVYSGTGADNDGVAYSFNNKCYAQYATKAIEIKPHTYYNLSFYYYSDYLGSFDSIISDVRVMKNGGENSDTSTDNLGLLSRTSAFYTNKHGLAVTRYDGTALSNVKAGKWQKVEVPFYSGDLESVLLAVRPVACATANATTGEPVYIDAITLTETDVVNFAYSDTLPFEGWGTTPRDTYTINFDDFYVPMDMSERIQLSKAPEKDGKTTIAAHILNGQHQSATVPNLKTVGSDTDPVFTVPVEESTKYSVSYSLYITKDQGTLDYFGFYYDFFYTNGLEDTTTIVRNSGMEERGEWVTFEAFFTTKPGQKVCSMIWNAGENNLDMYIDDIVLRKIVPGVVYSAEDTSYCEDFYNTFIDNGILDDISGAKSGVYKIPVQKDVFYTFGLDVVKANASSNSRIFVSFDGVNPLPLGVSTAPSSIITGTTKFGRYAYDFVTNSSGYVYVVIENDDGALKISDPTLFLAYRLTKSENKGVAQDPNQSFLTHNGELAELWVLGANESVGENPSTGSSSVFGALCILILALLISVWAIRFKKEAKVYEK